MSESLAAEQREYLGSKGDKGSSLSAGTCIIQGLEEVNERSLYDIGLQSRVGEYLASKRRTMTNVRGPHQVELVSLQATSYEGVEAELKQRKLIPMTMEVLLAYYAKHPERLVASHNIMAAGTACLHKDDLCVPGIGKFQTGAGIVMHWRRFTFRRTLKYLVSRSE